MRINIKTPEIFRSYAEELRKRYYGPNASVAEYKDSFVFGFAVDSFNAQPDILKNYLKTDKELSLQRMVTLRQNTYDKLESISKSLNCTISSAFRAVIIYTIESDTNNKKSSYSDLEFRVLLLEKQLADCQETLSQIKKFLN